MTPPSNASRPSSPAPSAAESAIPRIRAARRFQGKVAGRIRCRDEQPTPCISRQPPEPPHEALLDPRRERQRRGQAEATRELCRRQAARQLHEGQRVPVRLDHDPLEDALVEPCREHRFEQRASVPVAERLDVELREVLSASIRSRAANTRPIFSASRRRATNTRTRIDARSTPLRVVDDTQKRPVLGRLRQKAEGCDADEKRIEALPTASPKGDLAEPRAVDQGGFLADRGSGEHSC